MVCQLSQHFSFLIDSGSRSKRILIVRAAKKSQSLIHEQSKLGIMVSSNFTVEAVIVNGWIISRDRKGLRRVVMEGVSEHWL